MNSWEPFLLHYGYWAVFGAILLEDFGLPLPGEAILIAGSVLASQGDMHIIPLLLLAWAGAVLGDNIGYGIGRLAGRHLVLQYGRYVLITRRRLDYAEKFFRNHGGIVVAVARFIAVLRQLNGIIAGMALMKWRLFLLYNVLGAALWVTAHPESDISEWSFRIPPIDRRFGLRSLLTGQILEKPALLSPSFFR